MSPPTGWRGDPRDLLLDFQLGLVPHLDVHQAEVFDTRFDIAIRVPDASFVSGRMGTAGIAPVGRARARFRVPGVPDVRVELDARVAADPATEAASEPRTKARFSSPFLDFVLHPDGRRMDVHLQLPRVRQSHPLAALRDVAAYLALLDAAYRAGKPVDADFRLSGELLGTGHITQPAPLAQPVAAWRDLVQDAWAAAKAFELPTDLLVSAHDLAPSQEPLRVLRALLHSAESRLRVETTITSPVLEPERLWCVPLAAEARIGPYVVQLAAGLLGNPTTIAMTEDGLPRQRLETTDVRVFERRLYHDPEVPEATVQALAATVGAAHEREMNVLLVTSDDGRALTSGFAPRAT